MAFDINHSVQESNPFSSHSTVHTPLLLFEKLQAHLSIYVTTIKGLTAGDVGRELNHTCDI